jgi:hypothetical protein
LQPLLAPLRSDDDIGDALILGLRGGSRLPGSRVLRERRRGHNQRSERYARCQSPQSMKMHLASPVAD